MNNMYVKRVPLYTFNSSNVVVWQRLITVIHSIIILSLLTGCFSKEKNDSQIFHYNEQTGISSLDPAFAKNQSIMWPVHQLYNTLIEVDDSLRLKPSLAKSWELSEDRLSYIFHLRDDVFFHDDACFPGGRGRKMTAADVVFSLQRLIDPKTASPRFVDI